MYLCVLRGGGEERQGGREEGRGGNEMEGRRRKYWEGRGGLPTFDLEVLCPQDLLCVCSSEQPGERKILSKYNHS